MAGPLGGRRGRRRRRDRRGVLGGGGTVRAGAPGRLGTGTFTCGQLGQVGAGQRRQGHQRLDDVGHVHRRRRQRGGDRAHHLVGDGRGEPGLRDDPVRVGDRAGRRRVVEGPGRRLVGLQVPLLAEERHRHVGEDGRRDAAHQRDRDRRPCSGPGCLLTKVIVPPLSTLFTGGVKFMISTVSWGAALALGAAAPREPPPPAIRGRRRRVLAARFDGSDRLPSSALPPRRRLLPYWGVTPVTLQER